MKALPYSFILSETLAARSTEMEGLIPTLCKAIKRSNSRRRYRCLSSGAAVQTWDRPDFNPDVVFGDRPPHVYKTPVCRDKERNGGHSRFKSYGASPASLEEYEGKNSKQKLVRFRSQQQKTFSCMAGGFAE
ncbi:uncharacterized protein J3R85_008153 [Psidium guajava]|nr:uncharacterized protein J3R85_008153 [Psidium guajava]